MLKIIPLVLILFFLKINQIQGQSLMIFQRDFDYDEYSLISQYHEKDSIEIINILASVREDLLEQSYLAAGYDSINFADTTKAFLTKGFQYYWKNLKFDSRFNNFDFFYRDTLIKNELVNYDELNEIYRKTLKYYQNRGYPFAQILVDNFEVNDSIFKAEVIIDKSDKYYFDSIIIKGDPKIDNYYLQNYLSLKKGSVFSMKKIEDVPGLINNISFLEETNNYELAFIEDRVELVLYLKDKTSNQFNGMIGILPNDQTDSRVLITGDVNLLLQNSFGKGELLNFNWERYDRESQNLFFEGFYPYIFRSNFGTGLVFKMERRDTSYLSTDLKINFKYFTFADNGFNVFYQRFDSYLIKAVQTQGEFANINTNMGGMSYKYTRLDNIMNPRSGISLNTSAAFGIRKSETENIENSTTTDSEEVLQVRSSINISYYYPIMRQMALRLSNKTAFMYSPTLFENEIYRIGGLHTIRGFDELSLSASGYTISSLEYRYLFEENSALFAFYDLAYFEKRFTKEETSYIGQGIGVGLNLFTNAGIFALVYALGKTDQSNFDLNNSKIHIGYRSSF